MIQLENFKGHIVLYCKNHYSVKDVDLIEGLQRIWAVRCGYDVEQIDKSSLEYIADFLYELVVKVKPNMDLVSFQKSMHKEFNKYYLNYQKDLSAMERLIYFYRNELVNLKVVEDKKTLIKLPKPQKRLFKRIVSGKGEYNDYKFLN